MSNTHRRRDETVELRRVGVYWTLVTGMEIHNYSFCFSLQPMAAYRPGLDAPLWTHPPALVTQFTIPSADNWQVTT